VTCEQTFGEMTMATIKRIHHVAISIPQDRHIAAVRFYRDVLGFEELSMPDTLPHIPIIAWFQIGDNELHLLEEPSDADGKRRHICLEVDALEPFRERLERNGEVTQEGDPIPGRPRFFCYDPAGNRLEFLVEELQD
jgi:catechol 2,3-dioxygenase-like lactoylglutathione lyase family enzyme